MTRGFSRRETERETQRNRDRMKERKREREKGRNRWDTLDSVDETSLVTNNLGKSPSGHVSLFYPSNDVSNRIMVTVRMLSLK